MRCKLAFNGKTNSQRRSTGLSDQSLHVEACMSAGYERRSSWCKLCRLQELRGYLPEGTSSKKKPCKHAHSHTNTGRCLDSCFRPAMRANKAHLMCDWSAKQETNLFYFRPDTNYSFRTTGLVELVIAQQVDCDLVFN